MRSALTFVAAAAIGLMTASAVSAAELIRVGNAGRESFSFTPANIGKEVGIFAKHGLDLDIAGFGGDAKLQQAMAANAVDIGLGSGPGLAFIAKGSPVKGIAAMAGPPLIFAMVVRADGAVKTIDDLKGRKVAISTVGSATNWLMNEVSRQHGWGFDGFTQVPIGENSARIAALKSGAVDACVVDIGSALNFVAARRRPHPDAVRRRGEKFHHARHFRHRHGHRAKARGADRVPARLVRDDRLHADEQGEVGRYRHDGHGHRREHHQRHL